MRNQFAPATIEAIAALLPSTIGMTPRELAALASVALSGASIRRILLLLVRAGRASFEGEMGQRRYRLSGGTT